MPFRAASFAASAVGTEPTGTVQNDVLLALAAVIGAATPSLPSGWTSLYSGNTGTAGYRVAYIVRGSSAPSNMTFTYATEVHVLGFYGLDTSSPIDAQSADGGSTVSTPNPPAVTVASSKGATVVTGGVTNNGFNNNWTAPAGFTLRSSQVNKNGILASEETFQAGSVNPAAFSGGGTGGWNGFSISLTPAAIVENAIKFAPYRKS